MARTIRAGVLAALVVSAVLALTACVGGASTPTAPPAPTASPTPTPTPTETPEPDPLAEVVAMVVRPTALELRRDDGSVVTALDYMSTASDAIALLTDLFDAPPTDEAYRGTNHTPPGVFHAWDDFVLDERFYDEAQRDGGALDYIWPRFAVYLDGPSVHGLDLASEQGFQAGDPWSSLAGDPVFDAQHRTCVGTPIETHDFTRPDGQPETATVVATASDDGSTVKWLGAPVTVADGCA